MSSSRPGQPFQGLLEVQRRPLAPVAGQLQVVGHRVDDLQAAAVLGGGRHRVVSKGELVKRVRGRLPAVWDVGAAACLVVGEATNSDFFRALAYIGFFLNLFNLLPIVPLDGGRAMAAMAPWMWFLGFAAIVALAVIFPNPIILIIAVFAGFETWKRWKQRRQGGAAQEAYYKVSPRNRNTTVVSRSN